MKKGLTLFLALLFSIPLAMAGGKWMFDSTNVIVDVNISSGVEIDYENSASFVESLTANLTFIPLSSKFQDVLNLELKPEPAEKTDVNFLYEWFDPTEENLDFEVNSRVRKKFDFPKVREKIVFPLDHSGIPDEVLPFLEASQNIDSQDPLIKRKANEIAAGEDDLYVVVFKIAEWTKNNIKYDLSTLTADVSQSASWTLRNGEGVCDELTSLFIGLLRSVGVPAKFVSGVSFTDSPQFPQNWGAHGWSEVYFPGTGWVPFDVTYGEYGYVDPTHIKLKESVDSDEPASQYSWRARDVDVDAKELDIETELVQYFGTQKDPIVIEASALHEKVDLNSYNVISATVKNVQDYYVPVSLFITSINEVEMIDSFSKEVLLKPKEEKTVVWRVKLKQGLNPSFVYTFPINVYSQRNITDDATFKAQKGEIVFTKDMADNVYEDSLLADKKTFSKKVDLSCSQESEYYFYETPEVVCSVKNAGTVQLLDVRVCLDNDCSTVDFGIAEEQSFSYAISEKVTGANQLKFSAKRKEVSDSIFYNLEVLDAPEVSIEDINVPESVKYGDTFKIEFALDKASRALPINANIVMTVNDYKFHEILLERVDGKKKFVINTLGKELSTKGNDFKISIYYEDSNGRAYDSEESFEVALEDVSFGQRIAMLFRNMERGLRNLFKSD